ncbi:MAG: hypothetical protein R2854_29460 [Caldilineaceae bacterium]
MRRSFGVALGAGRVAGDDGDDDLALGVALFQVAERAGRLRQRIAAVDDGLDFARLNEFLHVEQVGLVGLHGDGRHGPVAAHGPERSQEQRLEDLAVGAAYHDIDAVRRQGAFVVCQRAVAVDAQDDVVLAAALAEVFLGVVDDVVRAQGAHHLLFCACCTLR